MAQQDGAPVFLGDPDQRPRSQFIGLTLSWTIFDGLGRYTTLQKSKIERKNISSQLEDSRRTALNEVATAWLDINRIFDVAPSVKDNVTLAETGYNRAVKRFNNGIGSQLDVSEAELQLRQAEVNYAQIVFDYLSAKARYDLAVGMVPYVDVLTNE